MIDVKIFKGLEGGFDVWTISPYSGGKQHCLASGVSKSEARRIRREELQGEEVLSLREMLR